MRANFQMALSAVLRHEGGYVNHPADPGGMTNLGVTKKVWEEWVGHPVDERAMRRLTIEDVAPLYKAKYWNKVNGDALPAGLDYVVFDCAVNSGPGRAAKFLQEAIGVTADGDIGPKTLKALEAHFLSEVVSVYQDKRLRFMQSLPTWATFGKGWERRVIEVAKVGNTMLAINLA